MTRSPIRLAVVSTRVDFVRRMLAGVATLPLESEAEFVVDPRMVAAGESFLWRALEALFDLARHVLAKGFAVAAAEYAAVARGLVEHGVVAPNLAEQLVLMAGYRNRLVHFYAEVTPDELYEILKLHLDDVEETLAAIQAWVGEHPELVDESL